MKEKLEEMGVKVNIIKMMRKDKTWFDAYVSFDGRSFFKVGNKFETKEDAEKEVENYAAQKLGLA